MVAGVGVVVGAEVEVTASGVTYVTTSALGKDAD